MEERECPNCKSIMIESYAYNSEMDSYDRLTWDNEPLWRCWNCGYFTDIFLNNTNKIKENNDELLEQ